MLNLPSLPNGTPQSNLAGVLPLSSLIEFIDTETKLHCYQLSGRGIAWNWPITPVGARLLLEFSEKEKHEESCLLDGGGRTAPLYCVDMRWGDQYNCINPFTIRACMESAPCIERLEIDNPQFRPQRLHIVHVFLKDELDGDREGKKFVNHKFSLKWLAVLLVGWTLWLSVAIFSMLFSCPISFVYLVTVAFTGLWVRNVFGSRARRLIKVEQSSWRRGVVVTDHFNETNWSLFVGNSVLVDSLLNKPLLRTGSSQPSRISPSTYTTIMKLILRGLIAVQWGLIVAASVMHNWDAIITSIFIIFCAFTTTFVFRTDDSIASWLQSNRIGLEKMTVTFSGRRAMISAMYAISPDQAFRWIDPIIAPSNDRTEWEKALDQVRRGLEPEGKPHIVNAIHEGTRIASYVNTWLLRREEYHKLPSRLSGQKVSTTPTSQAVASIPREKSSLTSSPLTADFTSDPPVSDCPAPNSI